MIQTLHSFLGQLPHLWVFVTIIAVAAFVHVLVERDRGVRPLIESRYMGQVLGSVHPLKAI
jgi:hypothetical protein